MVDFVAVLSDCRAGTNYQIYNLWLLPAVLGALKGCRLWVGLLVWLLATTPANPPTIYNLLVHPPFYPLYPPLSSMVNLSRYMYDETRL